MNLWQRLKGLFSRNEAPAQEENNSFLGRLRETRQERKRQREYKRSQRRMQHMERQRQKEEERQKEERKSEEQEAKQESEKEERRRYEKARKTFKERWDFSDAQYDRFMQFVNSLPREYIEQLGSETLVEFFRTGETYKLSSDEMATIVKETMETSEGMYAEDIINDLYTNMEGYAQNIKNASGGNI